jgi:mRNA interferase YafQ
MRSIFKTRQFRKDQKREKKGQHKDVLEHELLTLVTLLMEDAELPERYKDHSLTGEWRTFRDAHVMPDLVLIYRKVGRGSARAGEAWFTQRTQSLIRTVYDGND